MTREVLNKLSDTNRKYLINLQETINKADSTLDNKQKSLIIEQSKSIARGYIMGLIHSNVLGDKDFRFVWSWFNLGILHTKGV